MRAARLSSSMLAASSAPRNKFKLAYGLYVPSAEKRISPMPLVIMLHGCEQDAHAFAAGTRMAELAERHGFAVLFPEQSKSAHAHRCWHWYEKPAQDGAGEARDLVDMIDSLVTYHVFDRRRIYIAGLSAGAAMAAIVSIRYPELIAAVGLHSGMSFGTASSALAGVTLMRRGAIASVERALAHSIDLSRFPGLPAIIIHGDADDVVRPSNRDQLLTQFMLLNRLDRKQSVMPADCAERAIKTVRSAHGASPRKYAYQLRDLYSGDTLLVRDCEVEGLGHAWSGGLARLAFNDARGPDASKMMWEFFKAHARLSA